ncbi:polysaccharide biosynthesis tyrosine autokinase [Pontiellaceae bacterium B12219]|nr:polysaccharide biosynthesis tyrosine autokinase [Pontiellaceae bacterium B12219]
MNKKSKKTEEHEFKGSPYGGAPYGKGPYSDPVYYGQASYGEDGEEGIDLMRLVQIGLRHWKTILLVTLLVVGLGLIYLKLATPIYRAHALMEMSVRKPRLVKESAVIEEQGGRLDTDMIFNTRLAKFQSTGMRLLVAKRYLAEHPSNTNSVERLAELIGEMTTWEVQRKSYVVEVSVDSPDPEEARDLANLYAESATVLMVEENQKTSDNAVQWLKKQAKQQELALAAAEQALVDYRTKVSIDALRNGKRVAEDNMVQLNTSMIELESKLLTDQALVKHLKIIEQQPEAAETVLGIIPDAEQLKEFYVEWWNAKMELAKLQKRYTDAHSSVKQAAITVDQTRERLEGYLATRIKSTENSTQVLAEQAEVLRNRIKQEKEEIEALELKIVTSEGRLNTLMREKEAADTTYRSVLSRIEESRMAADENTAVLKLLQAAELPEIPVSPRKLRILALAIFLGGMFGYGLAWLIELLEDKVTGIRDIEKMGLTMLALIPQQKEADRPKLAKLCMQDKFSHVTETFASLRVMLTYKEAKERYQVVLITSTQPAEGKTVTASNLAISMAQSGRKTLLIDFDLRRPRLKKIFAADKDVISLMHLLEKKDYEAFATLPFNGGIEHLDVIASRPSDTISPTELIGGEGMEKLIAWARSIYECVIIDSPPLGVVGDSQGIADLVDGVILTAKPEFTRKRALRYTAERIESVNTNVIGVVLDNVRIRRHHTYSSQYHHYNSYYAYGSYRSESTDAAEE